MAYNNRINQGYRPPGGPGRRTRPVNRAGNLPQQHGQWAGDIRRVPGGYYGQNPETLSAGPGGIGGGPGGIGAGPNADMRGFNRPGPGAPGPNVDMRRPGLGGNQMTPGPNVDMRNFNRPGPGGNQMTPGPSADMRIGPNADMRAGRPGSVGGRPSAGIENRGGPRVMGRPTSPGMVGAGGPGVRPGPQGPGLGETGRSRFGSPTQIGRPTGGFRPAQNTYNEGY